MTGVAVAAVAGWLAAAGKVTVLTGAGISTDSGIPDFRGPQGVWTRDPQAQRMFSIDAYLGDATLRRKAWRTRLGHPAWRARPNAGHLALVRLERAARLRAIVTQNIDGLHQRAGSDPQRVLELHGTLFEAQCLRCDARTAMADALARVTAGEDDPACQRCGGILKSATVSFGQRLDADLLERAAVAAADCDVFLAVGTSLTVHPAADLVSVAERTGARIVIVNATPTPYDRHADAVLREPISEILPTLIPAPASAP